VALSAVCQRMDDGPGQQGKGRGLPHVRTTSYAAATSRANGRVPPPRSLAVQRPEVAAELHPTRNGGVDPRALAAYSNRAVWWLCPRCGNEWQAAANARGKAGRCPGCRYVPGRCRHFVVSTLAGEGEAPPAMDPRHGAARVSIVGSDAMRSIEQLVQSIDIRLETLRGEIEALTRAREKLVATGAARARPTPASPRRNARRASRSQESRPSTEVAPAGKLHRLLAASDGLSTATLAERANADPAQVLPLLREMEVAGRVRRSGQRRGTRWHAVASEEEWIAHRAAELAGRSRSA
jgi:hypothetical protein